jgi:hypothetical protein
MSLLIPKEGVLLFTARSPDKINMRLFFQTIIYPI